MFLLFRFHITLPVPPLLMYSMFVFPFFVSTSLLILFVLSSLSLRLSVSPVLSIAAILLGWSVQCVDHITPSKIHGFVKFFKFRLASFSIIYVVPLSVFPSSPSRCYLCLTPFFFSFLPLFFFFLPLFSFSSLPFFFFSFLPLFFLSCLPLFFFFSLPLFFFSCLPLFFFFSLPLFFFFFLPLFFSPSFLPPSFLLLLPSSFLFSFLPSFLPLSSSPSFFLSLHSVFLSSRSSPPSLYFSHFPLNKF